MDCIQSSPEKSKLWLWLPLNCLKALLVQNTWPALVHSKALSGNSSSMSSVDCSTLIWEASSGAAGRLWRREAEGVTRHWMSPGASATNSTRWWLAWCSAQVMDSPPMQASKAACSSSSPANGARSCGNGCSLSHCSNAGLAHTRACVSASTSPKAVRECHMPCCSRLTLPSGAKGFGVERGGIQSGPQRGAADAWRWYSWGRGAWVWMVIPKPFVRKLWVSAFQAGY